MSFYGEEDVDLMDRKLAALERQLAETKAVLGDLIQEKVAGIAVYVLQFGLETRGVYLSLEAAMRPAQVHYPLGHWIESNPHGRYWELKGDPQIRTQLTYFTTEHKLK